MARSGKKSESRVDTRDVEIKHLNLKDQESTIPIEQWEKQQRGQNVKLQENVEIRVNDPNSNRGIEQEKKGAPLTTFGKGVKEEQVQAKYGDALKSSHDVEVELQRSPSRTQPRKVEIPKITVEDMARVRGQTKNQQAGSTTAEGSPSDRQSRRHMSDEEFHRLQVDSANKFVDENETKIRETDEQENRKSKSKQENKGILSKLLDFIVDVIKSAFRDEEKDNKDLSNGVILDKRERLKSALKKDGVENYQKKTVKFADIVKQSDGAHHQLKYDRNGDKNDKPLEPSATPSVEKENSSSKIKQKDGEEHKLEYDRNGDKNNKPLGPPATPSVEEKSSSQLYK